MLRGGWKGFYRLTIVVGAIVAVVFLLVACREPVSSALVAFERFAPKPGLSGLALLLLTPPAFLLFLSVVEWILNGFGRSMQSN